MVNGPGSWPNGSGALPHGLTFSKALCWRTPWVWERPARRAQWVSMLSFRRFLKDFVAGF